jgi:hypothetical protein
VAPHGEAEADERVMTYMEERVTTWERSGRTAEERAMARSREEVRQSF